MKIIPADEKVVVVKGNKGEEYIRGWMKIAKDEDAIRWTVESVAAYDAMPNGIKSIEIIHGEEN